MHIIENLSAGEALKKLLDGNRRFLNAEVSEGDISPQIRRETCENGQKPYAIIITCSDSRVIPESIFSAGIGELFVIRVAGNVIDSHQLGSIEYAAGHLGCKIIMVLGHTHCGAVDAAINGDPDGYIKYITNEIKLAVGGEKDDYRACCLNARRSVEIIEQSLEIRREEAEEGLRVVAAIYRIDDGRVEIIQ